MTKTQYSCGQFAGLKWADVGMCWSWENENDRIDLCNATATVTRLQRLASPQRCHSFPSQEFTAFTWLIQTQPQLAGILWNRSRKFLKRWRLNHDHYICLLASCMRRFIIFELLFCKAYSEFVVPIYTQSEDWEWSCFYTRIPVFSATLTCHSDTDRSYNQVRGLWQRNAGSDTRLNGSELQSSQCWLLVSRSVSCVSRHLCHIISWITN